MFNLTERDLSLIFYDSMATPSERDKKYFYHYFRTIQTNAKSINHKVFENVIQAYNIGAAASDIIYQVPNWKEVNIEVKPKRAAVFEDEFDKTTINIPAMLFYVNSVKAALELTKDQAILDLLLTAMGIPTIDIETGSSPVGPTGLNYIKLLSAGKLLDHNNADKMRCIIHNADGASQIMQEDQFIDQDYTVGPILEDGKLETFLNSYWWEIGKRVEGGLLPYDVQNNYYFTYMLAKNAILGVRGTLDNTIVVERVPNKDGDHVLGRSAYGVGIVLPNSIAKVEYVGGIGFTPFMGGN
jgi:hypothetical protein